MQIDFFKDYGERCSNVLTIQSKVLPRRSKLPSILAFEENRKLKSFRNLAQNEVCVDSLKKFFKRI